MNFCAECGSTVSLQIPENDDRSRYVCTQCHAIHYQNPKIVVGTIPALGDKVLLCKRAIEPRKGFWTVPAGFMENGETTQAGAERETWEEAQAKVIDTHLYRLFDLPTINQLYIFYRCQLEGEYGAGPESLEVKLCSQEEIPWSQIAFPVVEEALREYFTDRDKGEFPIRISKGLSFVK